MAYEPKPTYYGGRMYRSQLEAQFAVFLDECFGTKWDYEPYLFDPKGVRYLPDFVFNNGEETMFVEIKPLARLDDEHAQKIVEFSHKYALLIVDNLLFRKPKDTFVEDYPIWAKWGLRPWDFYTINGVSRRAFPAIDDDGILRIIPDSDRKFVDYDRTFDAFEKAKSYKFKEVGKR